MVWANNLGADGQPDTDAGRRAVIQLLKKCALAWLERPQPKFAELTVYCIRLLRLAERNKWEAFDKVCASTEKRIVIEWNKPNESLISTLEHQHIASESFSELEKFLKEENVSTESGED